MGPGEYRCTVWGWSFVATLCRRLSLDSGLEVCHWVHGLLSGSRLLVGRPGFSFAVAFVCLLIQCVETEIGCARRLLAGAGGIQIPVHHSDRPAARNLEAKTPGAWVWSSCVSPCSRLARTRGSGGLTSVSPVCTPNSKHAGLGRRTFPALAQPAWFDELA